MSKKKKVAYIATNKCGTNSIMSALRELGDVVDCDSHDSHQLKRFWPEMTWADDETKKSLNTKLDAVNVRVNAGAMCSIPYAKYPRRWQEAYGPDEKTNWPGYLTDYSLQGGGKDGNWSPLEKNLSKIFTDEFYTWTVVRNPWDRMASGYFQSQKNTACDISFDLFVRSVIVAPLAHQVCDCKEADIIMKSHLGRAIRGDLLQTLLHIKSPHLMASAPANGSNAYGRIFNHFLELWPCKMVAHDCNRSAMVHTQNWEDSNLFRGYRVHRFNQRGCWEWGAETARKEPEPIDKVIRFENLQEGFDEVMEEIGWPTMKLPLLNEGAHSRTPQKYRELYDAETIELVREHFAYEIETFGYEFGK